MKVKNKATKKSKGPTKKKPITIEAAIKETNKALENNAIANNDMPNETEITKDEMFKQLWLKLNEIPDDEFEKLFDEYRERLLNTEEHDKTAKDMASKISDLIF